MGVNGVGTTQLNRRDFLTLMAAAMASARGGWAMSGAAASGNEFVLPAVPRNPFYIWPRTLLAYPLAADSRASANQAVQCVETGEVQSIQIAAAPGQGGERSLLFLGDLGAGETRTYRLIEGRAPANGQQSIAIANEAGSIAIDTGAMRVRIPASQTITGAMPGPILQVSRGGAWTGSSQMQMDGCRFTRIDTEELEHGPLRSIHRVTYRTDSDAKYVATVECIAGMDFVRLHEEMESLPAGATGEFDFAWTGCTFTHRQGPNHPYNFPRRPLSDYTQYPWEAIAPAHMDTQFGVSPGLSPTGRMPFSLRLFEPWSDALAACFANFWSDDATDAAAIFIDHMEEWEDHEYAIWHSSPRLAVEFVYKAGTLHFVWKMGRGSRSSCVCFYDHARDVEAMKRLEDRTRGVSLDGRNFRAGLFPTSHALELQNWHGTLNLDKAKDWALQYPEAAGHAKPTFTNLPFQDGKQLYRILSGTDFLSDLALSGVRQNNGFGPTSSRQVLESWVPCYNAFRDQLSPEERRNLESILLLLAYVHAGEDYMPLQRMLAGHPNFLSDVKSTPCGMAFLFPEHPAADDWSDTYEAFLRMNTRYHTRPAVSAWGTHGGRWTENLGTYVWAFLRPASRGSFLLKCRDGQERLCGPQLAEMGEWLVNALSAPFAGESPETMKRIEAEMAHNEGARRHYWGIVTEAMGPRRVHPPQGAHSERRKTPRTMWYLGHTLRNYAPLTAEHVMWAARPTDQDMEATADQGDPYGAMYPKEDNRGTDPHLETSKYTGYGIVMRAEVGTPAELSVHLMQIDDGPNYRWGTAGEGGCGEIYFYANGKGYSHNGGEDSGDRIDQDTDFCTNFGVWKDGAFRSVGQNTLSRPLYDLNVAQFAEIVPRTGSRAYSWPEYVSRGILLAGDDYFLVYDKVFNPEIAHRFSWFVRKGDEFPHIELLSDNPRDEANRFTTVETEDTTGRWAEGSGDSLVLVTHKEGIRAMRAPYGANVATADGNDVVFLSHEPTQFRQGEKEFTGTCGVIRERKGSTDFALVHGTHIGAAGLSVSTSDTDLGVSASIGNSGSIRGFFFAPQATEMELKVPERLKNGHLFIDGEQAGEGEAITVKLQAGKHAWEMTETLPRPMAPRVDHTENTADGAVVVAAPVSSAAEYVLEISADNAKTWTPAGKANEPKVSLTGLKPGMKYHVRFSARNADQASEAGPEYPLYVTAEAPPAPDGVHVALTAGKAEITWGEVLGVSEFRLYRRTGSAGRFAVAYSGRATRWTDMNPAIEAPGQPRPRAARAGKAIACEYYVTAVNHVAESKPSRTVDTDPESWRNWNPTGDEPFRRTVERTEGELPNDGGGRYYPA